jgi:hypothetical protein
MTLVHWEIWSYLQVPLFWFLFWKFGRQDVSGSFIAGSLVGLFVEFSTEPLWTYHFRYTFYKDVTPSIILGWGVLLTLTVFFSEKLYRWLLNRNTVDPNDRRLFLFDALAAGLIAFPMETMGLKAGVWTYNLHILDWTWGTVPVFEMPFEALFGYMLLMTIAPTFIRRWRQDFSIGHLWISEPAPRKTRTPPRVVRPARKAA